MSLEFLLDTMFETFLIAAAKTELPLHLAIAAIFFIPDFVGSLK